jgi:hypothetical protein
MTSLSCQNSKLSICHSFIDKGRQPIVVPSTNSSFRFLLCSLRNQITVFLSFDGRRESVRNVSSTNPGGNKSLPPRLVRVISLHLVIKVWGLGSGAVRGPASLKFVSLEAWNIALTTLGAVLKKKHEKIT